MYALKKDPIDLISPREQVVPVCNTSAAPVSQCVDQIISEAFVEHLDALLRYARKLTRNEDDANDLLQQTCLRAWLRRETYDREKLIRPWLFAIMHKEFLQLLRKKTPVTNVEDFVFETHEDNRIGDSLHYEAHRLNQGMKALSRAHWDALTMVSLLGYSYEEAAILLGCKGGTIKSRVNRAKQKIIEEFG